VTITLDTGVYSEIKRLSRAMGIRPSTWMAMVCTSKANNLEVNVVNGNGNGIHNGY
jgi:hypothetical protein